MNEYLEKFRAEWNRAASGWEKWDAWLDRCYAQFNQSLIQQAAIAPGSRVLDLGSGSGYPAVAVAHTVGVSGKVVGLDFSEGMLQVAKTKAAALGLQNVEFRVCDITSLPLESNSFDAAVSRFAVMFVPDAGATLRELFRVLKPGAGFAISVWGDPDKNPLPMFVLKEYLDLPPVDLSVPGPYRFFEKGKLKGMLEDCGFERIHEEEVRVEEVFPSGREFTDHVLEMAAPLIPLFAKLPEERRNAAINRLISEAEKYRLGNEVRVPRVALVVSGQKPV